MPYWEIVTRSFRIAWDHKYLWLIALFSGEVGSSFSFNYSQRRTTFGTGRQPDVAAALQRTATWVHDNLGLILALAVLWLALLVAFFILAAVCEAATVRASAEHDAGRPFDLGRAWRAGVVRMWVVVRFRLILVALALPVFAIFAGLVTASAIAFLNGSVAAGVAVAAFALVFGLAGVPYVIYLSFLDRFGSRAVVLELLEARAAVARAHRLLFHRLGRAMLVWLLSIAVAILVGICLAVVGAIVFLPLVLAGIGAAAGGPAWLWLVVVAGAAVTVPALLVVLAFLAAQSSTYWTLAFRRMDVEYPPAFAYPPQPVPQR